VRTGSKLKQAKEKVGHGNFVRWVNDNCTVSRQYATDYMRLADEYPQLIDTNGNSRLHLPTITQARAMLSAPSDVKTEVIERIENGETVPTAEIKQLKKQAADAIALAEKMNAETAELREKIANNETRLAQAEKAINEKVNDRDEIEAELNALLAEGGVDKLIEQKTATATAKIAELNNDIHFLQTERTAAIERGVQIELNKKAQEVKALDDKLDAKKSALETVESKLKQSKTNAVYNANHQQAAAKLIDLIQATRLLVNTATTPENPIFEHKTIKLMTEAAKDCTALAHLLNDLVLLKQTEIEQLAADH
jgi:chromosome segregation ATPase